MKKIFFPILILFLLNGIITFAQTSVPGGTVSGIWTLSGSPYNIQGNIQIPNDSTLTIQPGIIINFQGTYKLNVQGRLLATGTITDTITFTASDTTIGWKGMRFNNTPSTNDTSKIIFCKLQYGINNVGDYGGALFFNNFSKTIISNSSVLYCMAFKGAGIYCNLSFA